MCFHKAAAEAEEEEEKNGAEEEADAQPVKRPAEEEVGLGFSFPFLNHTTSQTWPFPAF